MLDSIRRFVRVAAPIFGSIALVVATSGYAAPTKYTFSGHLTNASLFPGSVNPDWPFALNQTFTGTLVYDPALAVSTQNIVNDPDWRVDAYASPVVSLRYVIDLGAGSYTYQAPVSAQAAVVSTGTAIWAWNGVELRMFNYPIAGVPSTPVPPGEWVGDYYPHSGGFTLAGDPSLVLPNTDPDFDFKGWFAAIPGSGSTITLRFSDPAAWPPGAEHVDGLVVGQIDQFTAAVPEPATWLAMLGGLGVIGAAMRRRRVTPEAA